MGLTNGSVGRSAAASDALVLRRNPNERIIAVAGNPNVGKSTVFNALTGMKQHTGNWPGKTVSNAQGVCQSARHTLRLVDIPGAYSLTAHSAEEEVARDFLCFADVDAVVIVCDATCLERNLNLTLQILEITSRAVVCVNLMDEAKKKGVRVDLHALEQMLGVPVVGTVARKKRTLRALLDAVDRVLDAPARPTPVIPCTEELEHAAGEIAAAADETLFPRLPRRFLALRLLEGDESFCNRIVNGACGAQKQALLHAVAHAQDSLRQSGVPHERLNDLLAGACVQRAEQIARAVTNGACGYSARDRTLDRLFTGRRSAYFFMLLFVALVLWLTIAAANVPSAYLAKALFYVQDRLSALFAALHAPQWLHDALVLGMYRTLAWVVSVMLPPMAIFFPFFTLLEDAGYLPRIAYNLDLPFQKCSACGKQALCMCMGFGCNAAGVVGCRIIDSPRERLLAVLTNSFVPCNGRFPTLIALTAMFFAGVSGTLASSLRSALILTGLIVLSVCATLLCTKLLSKTVLRGMPSSFTLEMPPYRRPQVGRVIVRSLTERTLFVLGRAAAVAAPAGLILFLLANIQVGGASLLSHSAAFLDPFARLFGLDGVILIAFILGLPANEIVVPIILMAYLSQGTLAQLSSLESMRQIFLANGWTLVTALCTTLFCLFHWPCSTTLLTIKKETGSWKYTALAFALPTAFGLLLCFAVAQLAPLLLG